MQYSCRTKTIGILFGRVYLRQVLYGCCYRRLYNIMGTCSDLFGSIVLLLMRRPNKVLFYVVHNVAVQYKIGLRRFDAGAMIFNHFIRMQYIGADLRAPFNFFLFD